MPLYNTQKFFRDPYTQTLSGFSKVTGLLKTVLTEPEDSATSSSRDDFSKLLPDDFAGLGLHLGKEPEAETGFEFVERVRIYFALILFYSI